MKKFLAFLQITYLWILLTPSALVFTGAVSNQLVLVANHDKFPVMLNEKRRAHADDGTGMLDNEHCVMTSKTHLNILADIFDFGRDGTESIGDLLIDAGEYTRAFAFFVWAFAVIQAIRRKEQNV